MEECDVGIPFSVKIRERRHFITFCTGTVHITQSIQRDRYGNILSQGFSGRVPCDGAACQRDDLPSYFLYLFTGGSEPCALEGNVVYADYFRKGRDLVAMQLIDPSRALSYREPD